LNPNLDRRNIKPLGLRIKEEKMSGLDSLQL
jgi:hypothetical protein